MILDSSAVIAITTREPSRPALLEALVSAAKVTISAATVVEIHAVLHRAGRADVLRRVERLFAQFGVDVVAFGAEQSRIASDAYRDYGRGSGHRANLNLGDCYSYALAAQRDEPLLFVGDNFTHTDLESVLDA